MHVQITWGAGTLTLAWSCSPEFCSSFQNQEGFSTVEWDIACLHGPQHKPGLGEGSAKTQIHWAEIVWEFPSRGQQILLKMLSLRYYLEIILRVLCYQHCGTSLCALYVALENWGRFSLSYQGEGIWGNHSGILYGTQGSRDWCQFRMPKSQCQKRMLGSGSSLAPRVFLSSFLW